MNALISSYPSLNGNDDWEELSLDFFEELEDTVTDSNSSFDRYREFEDGVEDYVRDTIREID